MVSCDQYHGIMSFGQILSRCDELYQATHSLVWFAWGGARVGRRLWGGGYGEELGLGGRVLLECCVTSDLLCDL